MMNGFFINGDMRQRCEITAIKNFKKEELEYFKKTLERLPLQKLVDFYNKVFDLISKEIVKIKQMNPGIELEFRCQTLADGYDFESEAYVAGILTGPLKKTSRKNIKHYSWYLYQRIEISDYDINNNSKMSRSFFDHQEFIKDGKTRLFYSIDELKERILNAHGEKYYLLKAKFIQLCKQELKIQLSFREPNLKHKLEKYISKGYNSSTETLYQILDFLK